MFNAKKFYRDSNDPIKASYKKTLAELKKIAAKTAKPPKDPALAEYYQYFHDAAGFALTVAEYERAVQAKDYYTARSFEQLLAENRALFDDVQPEHYPRSYSDPARCVKLFGDGTGQLLAYLYVKLRQQTVHAVQHKLFKMEEAFRVLAEAYRLLAGGAPRYEDLLAAVTAPERGDQTRDLVNNFREAYGPDFTPWVELVQKADLADPRYLFRYNRYISDNEIKTAAFFQRYPEAKLKKLAKVIVRAYVNGFKSAGKDLAKKTTVNLMFYIGQERLVRYLVKDLKKAGLRTLIVNPQTSKVNEQYGYDHRFDTALFLSPEYTATVEQSCRRAAEQCRDLIGALSGMVLLTKFGEPPFRPQAKPECLKLSEAQQQQYQAHMTALAKIQEQYAPRREMSFTIISVPAPEIGQDFERIFEDILEVNMLDSRKYEAVQQAIIDALDRADHVLIKGTAGNRTDLRVKLAALADPAAQTLFENCGANVNIPVGEVFTSPRLAGTTGTLHIGQTFLGGLKYADLQLDFTDGYVTGYSCGNFEDPGQNRKYIEENLLFPHKTLPLGEFAIGTNTLAYVMAKKYDILSVLPVLIIEKMGPHFAIGDTCFAFAEDLPVRNPDGKEIMARDNEKTALRATDMQQAYTYRHTDITLPYEEIGLIAAVTAAGEKINIIRNGRFVLPGTRKLNKPFDQLESK
ncbi:MAG TPA: aminopeptidase [Candidatus Edwardsbacteria bacterium]|nr:aminopeptidase [Candidatus Edwardsbacteria bacterium]